MITKQKNQELTDSSEQVRTINRQKEREIESLKNDLCIVSQQNKSFSQEIERLGHLNSQMKLNYNTLQKKEIEVQEKERLKENHMQDIMREYRKCAEENELLKRQVKEIQLSQRKEFDNFKMMERDLHLISKDRSALFEKQKQYMQEIGNLEQTVQHLNRELERYRLELQNAETTNNRLLNEHKSINHITHALKNDNQDVYKKLSATDCQNVIFSFGTIHSYKLTLFAKILT